MRVNHGTFQRTMDGTFLFEQPVAVRNMTHLPLVLSTMCCAIRETRFLEPGTSFQFTPVPAGAQVAIAVDQVVQPLASLQSILDQLELMRRACWNGRREDLADKCQTAHEQLAAYLGPQAETIAHHVANHPSAEGGRGL